MLAFQGMPSPHGSTCNPHSSSRTPKLPNLTLPIFVSALPGAFEGCFISPSLLNESLYSFLGRLPRAFRGNLPASAGGMGDGVQSLGQEDLLEE